jgi:hypothetical protein
MTMIKVYSTAPVAHGFDLGNTKYVFKGTNSNSIEVKGELSGAPHITEIDEAVFAQIQDKYKAHIYIFGGVTSDGVKIEPMIYTAKTDSDAKKKQKDKEPVIPDNSIVTKQKTVEVMK